MRTRFSSREPRTARRRSPDGSGSHEFSAVLNTFVARSLFLLGGAVLGVVLLLGGCDTSVQAVVPSDRYHYSVFGVLNPVEDTQWVRVEPLAASTSAGAPSTLDVTVTLEKLSNGRTWTLRDSLMEVFEGEPQHNFWTTATIEPGTSYRLTVANSDGDTTQAQTTTPSAPPEVTPLGPIRLPCLDTDGANTFDVRVDGSKELAGLKVRYFQNFRGVPLTFLFDSYADAERRDDTVYTATVNYLEDLRTTNQTRSRQCIADSAHVIAAAGGPDWPEWARYNDASISEVARPDSFSNVKGGHGMFSGVYTSRATVSVEERNPD